MLYTNITVCLANELKLPQRPRQSMFKFGEVRILKHTYTSGFEGGALTRGVCAADCTVTPAGLTTVRVSAPTVTVSCPAPSNSAPLASRTSSRATFTSKRSCPTKNFLLLYQQKKISSSNEIILYFPTLLCKHSKITLL